MVDEPEITPAMIAAGMQAMGSGSAEAIFDAMWRVRPDRSRFLSSTVVARRIGMDPGTVRRWCRKLGFGEKAGGRWLIPIENLAKIPEIVASAAKPAPVRPIPSVGEVKHIQSEIANHFGIPLEVLLGHSQTRCAVLPRQIAIFIAWRLTKNSFMQIGRLFERDHTTIMHAQRRMTARYNSDLKFRNMIDRMESELRGKDASVEAQG